MRRRQSHCWDSDQSPCHRILVSERDPRTSSHLWIRVPALRLSSQTLKATHSLLSISRNSWHLRATLNTTPLFTPPCIHHGPSPQLWISSLFDSYPQEILYSHIITLQDQGCGGTSWVHLSNNWPTTIGRLQRQQNQHGKGIAKEGGREKNTQRGITEILIPKLWRERLWGRSHSLRGPSWLAFDPSKSSPYEKVLNPSTFLKVRI